MSTEPVPGPATPGAGAPPPRRYAAFVSYRHADNREEGRHWAEWIHHALETYEVPRDLVGSRNERGEPVPASLYPVFRDEEELSAHALLSGTLHGALEASGTLVVVCSPRACESGFVDQEIRAFKEMGRGERILALVVDGEPGVDDPARSGDAFAPETECLPRALRFGAPDGTGGLDWTRRTDPIAADARPGGRPEQGYTNAALYAEALRRGGGRSRAEVSRLERQFAERLDLARLKVIAGVLGVSLGQLRRRDAVYRARRFRRLATVFGGLALVALVAAGVAVWQTHRAEENFNRAEDARRRQRAQLVEASRHSHASAEAEIAAGRWRQGVTLLGQALRYDPENAAAAARLWNALAYGEGDRDEPPLSAWAVGSPVLALASSPDDRRVAAVTADGRLHLLDVAAGRTRVAPLASTEFAQRLRFDASGERLVFGAGRLQSFLASWGPGGEDLGVVPLEGTLHDSAFSRDGDLLGIGVRGVERFDGRSGRRTSPAGAEADVTMGGIFTPDGRSLLRRSQDDSFEVLDPATGATRPVSGLEPQEMLLFAALSTDAVYLGVLGGGSAPSVIDLRSGARVVAAPRDQTRWTACAFAPDLASCVVGGLEGRLEVHALPDGALRGPLIRHEASRVCAAFSADGRRVLSAGSDGWIAAWRLPSPRRFEGAPLGEAPVQDGAWISETDLAVLRGESVEVWAVDGRGMLARFDAGPNLGRVAHAPDGSWLATWGPGGRIRIHTSPWGSPPRVVQGPAVDSYQVLATEAPERVLVSAFDLAGPSPVHRLALLDVRTGRPVGPEVLLDRFAVRVGASRDGARLLACQGAAGPWRAWDSATGTELPSVSEEDRRVVLATPRRAGIGEIGAGPVAVGEAPRVILDSGSGLPRTGPLGSPRALVYWSPGGGRVLVIEKEGPARLLETPQPGPPGPWLEDLAAAAGGLGLTESGLGRPLPLHVRVEAMARLREARVDDPSWARLLAWWLRSR